MYQVVHFIETNEVELVPESWLCGKDSCLWPPVKSYTTIGKLVRNLQSPNPSWPKYKVRYLGHPEASYELSCQKLRKATVQSDISDSDEGLSRLRKQRKRNKRHTSDSDEEPSAASKNLFNLPPAPSCVFPSIEFRSPNVDVEDLIKAGVPNEDIESAFNSTVDQPVDQNLQYLGATPAPLQGTSRHTTPTGTHGRTAKVVRRSLREADEFMAEQPDMALQSLQSTSNNNAMSTTQIQGQCHCSAKLDDIHRILTNLTLNVKIMAGTQRQHSELLHSIIDGPRIQSDTQSVLDFGLPLENIQQLDDFNKRFKLDSEFRAKLVSYLSSFGGANLSAATNRLLREMFTDNLASKIAWTGRTQKPGLCTYDFHNAIIDAVRSDKKFKDISRDEIEKSIKSWLNHANERISRVVKKTSSNITTSSTAAPETDG